MNWYFVSRKIKGWMQIFDTLRNGMLDADGICYHGVSNTGYLWLFVTWKIKCLIPYWYLVARRMKCWIPMVYGTTRNDY